MARHADLVGFFDHQKIVVGYVGPIPGESAFFLVECRECGKQILYIRTEDEAFDLADSHECEN